MGECLVKVRFCVLAHRNVSEGGNGSKGRRVGVVGVHGKGIRKAGDCVVLPPLVV